MYNLNINFDIIHIKIKNLDSIIKNFQARNLWEIKMKQYDFVKLIKINDKYKQYNLYIDATGIVWETLDNRHVKVLFMNKYNECEYAYLVVDTNDLEVTQSDEFFEVKNFINKYFNKIVPIEKGFSKKEFNAYDDVELLIEDPKFAELGIHKGDIGTIMEDYAANNEVLVDFGRLDENNNFLGDCVSVNLKDLKILK